MTQYWREKSLFQRGLIFALVLFSSIILIQLHSNNKASAAYEHGRLIDDPVFLDAQSLSKEQVQSFFTSKGAGLGNMSFKVDCDLAGTQAKQIYQSLGAPCGQNAPASHIIYYAAQVYGVSPKVILATMEKEQGVATEPNPDSWQINQAMGYNCPTSGACESDSGFFYQIDNGTWVLRYHFERARGNNSWWSPSNGWDPCGTPKPSYYTPNLYPRQNVNFVDPYSGVQYVTVYIENAATAAFYCYTPHVYNNHTNSPHPKELKGNSRCYPFTTHPPSGDRGRCYTGSFNFVRYYESWFGSTRTPSFSAQFRAQSSNPIIRAGDSINVYMQFINTGSAFWKDDASVFPGYKPVHLATTNPINRSTSFRSNSWLSPSRPNGNFTKVLEADGWTLASDQHTVQPGQIAEYQFTLTVPHDHPGGVFREYFQPILEDSPSWNLGSWTYIDVGVHKPVYKAQYKSQSQYPIISPGFTHDAYIEFTNAGNEPWYDDTSVPANRFPVHLATSWPINRASRFSNNWPNAARPNLNFSKVYESNGTTLASNQHIVLPGQIARFEFQLKNHENTVEGFYPEYFEPILEGAPGWMWNMGASAWLNVGIPSPTTRADYVSQSASPTITPGGAPATVFFNLRNTGNTLWQDDSSVISGKYPVHLATSWPINRGSDFVYAWPHPARPVANFTAVYEKDGFTPTSNQHIVYPGQVARFEFQVQAKANLAPGFYREYFDPILEGSPGYTWNMQSTVWIGITVQ